MSQDLEIAGLTEMLGEGKSIGACRGFCTRVWKWTRGRITQTGSWSGAFFVILLAFCCTGCGSRILVPVWGSEDSLAGFGIGNRFSGGKSKLCGGNSVRRVAWHCIYIWPVFRTHFHTVLYCTASYPFRFSARRQNSDLELLGPCLP